MYIIGSEEHSTYNVNGVFQGGQEGLLRGSSSVGDNTKRRRFLTKTGD